MSAALRDSFTQRVNALWPIDKRSENRDYERSLAACDAALEEIELIRRHVNDVLDAARTRITGGRNWVPWIKRLPVEVLCDIFRFSGGFGFDHDTNRAIAATCTQWRAVALNDHLMWTCLDINRSRDYWELILERSRHMPLSVRIRLWDNVASEMAIMLKGNNISRLRSLAITQAAPRLSPCPRLNAPLLEDLTIHTYDNTAMAMVPSELPALRTLDLSGSYFPWVPGKYKNLIHIKIHCTAKGSVHPSWKFGIMFTESPNLESIDLSILYLPEWRPFVTGWHTRKARLLMPKLRHVSLAMELYPMMHILRSLEMPHLEKICIANTFSGLEDGTEIDSLFAKKYLPTSALVDMRELTIVHAPGVIHLLGIITEREFIRDAIMASYDGTHKPMKHDVDIDIQLTYREDMTSYPEIRPSLEFLKSIPMPFLNYLGVLRTPQKLRRGGVASEASWTTADVNNVLSFLLSRRTISSFTLDCHTPKFAAGFVNNLFHSINGRPLSGPEAFFPSLARCRLALHSIRLRQATQFIPLLRALLSSNRLDVLLVDQTKPQATPKEEDELQLLLRTSAGRMIMSRHRYRGPY